MNGTHVSKAMAIDLMEYYHQKNRVGDFQDRVGLICAIKLNAAVSFHKTDVP